MRKKLKKLLLVPLNHVAFQMCQLEVLSGGLDSTIVACLASKPHTWTVGFKDNNEFEWARIVEKNSILTIKKF